MDWLAACQALDPPPNPVPSALPVIGHCRLLLAAKEAGHSFRKGQLSPGPGHEGGGGAGSIKVPVALATLASGHFGENSPGKQRMEGEEAVLSLAGVCP